MSRLVLLVEYQGQATPPEGDPPRLSVQARSQSVSVLHGEGPAPQQIEYESEVTITGEGTFVEDGAFTFDGTDRVPFTTVGQGTLGPSPEEGLQQGSVIWRVESGEGGFADASGLITSSFVTRDGTNDVSEHQVLALFMP